MAQRVILTGIYACIWVGGIRMTPPTQSWYSPSYISLHYHPGVGQTHVPFCAKELEAFLQIPLCVVINLQQQDEKKKKTRCFQNKTIEQTSLLLLVAFALDVSIFFVWQRIVLTQAATNNRLDFQEKLQSCLKKVEQQKQLVDYFSCSVSWNDFLCIGAKVIN